MADETRVEEHAIEVEVGFSPSHELDEQLGEDGRHEPRVSVHQQVLGDAALHVRLNAEELVHDERDGSQELDSIPNDDRTARRGGLEFDLQQSFVGERIHIEHSRAVERPNALSAVAERIDVVADDERLVDVEQLRSGSQNALPKRRARNGQQDSNCQSCASAHSSSHGPHLLPSRALLCRFSAHALPEVHSGSRLPRREREEKKLWRTCGGSGEGRSRQRGRSPSRARIAAPVRIPAKNRSTSRFSFGA